MERIAVDFDGTLCRAMYHKKEFTQSWVHKLLLKYLIRKQKKGAVIILNTLRTEQYWINHAIDWLEARGLSVDYVNENTKESVEEWDKDSRKIDADVYIDDRNIGFFGWLLKNS